MKWIAMGIAAIVSGTVFADTTIEQNFNDLANGPIEGQGWNIYDKVRDSSAFSVVSEVGTTEKQEDKALVIKASDKPIRCVADKPIRWISDRTLHIEFDFKLAIPPRSISGDTPAMIFYIGNPVLSKKARWAVHLDAIPDAGWKLTAALPDEASLDIPAKKLLVRSGSSVSISKWFHFVLEIRKKSLPDSFESKVIIMDESGKKVAELQCKDSNKDEVTKEMWNMPRLYTGFYAPNDLYGLVCIDNLEMKYSL